jgi:hypothetical protein
MASLPDFLFDTHKRYKADTNRVAEWLAKTAQKWGLKLETHPSSSRPSGGRLKGKARQEAGKAAANPQSAHHIITVKGFTDMAQFIVQQSPPIRVPDTIIGLLRSAISLRQRCSQWFLSQSIEEDRLLESTDKHSHFIDVLEDVLEILEPYSRRAASQDHVGHLMEKLNLNVASKLPAEPQQPAEQHGNPYDILFIEEDSVVVEADPGASSSTETRSKVHRAPTGPPPSKVTYEMEPTEEEIHFGIFCFFDDLNRLRTFLGDLWTQYKLGSCDLITAAVTTNSTLELVRCAEKDLTASFPKNDTYKKTGGLYFDFMCNLRGEDPNFRERPDDPLNFNMFQVAEWLFLPINMALEYVLPKFLSNLVPVVEPYNPLTDRSTLTNRQRRQQDFNILAETLPGFIDYIWLKVFLVPDELFHGIRSMFATKIVTTSVTFSTQIYLDIHHLLGEDIGRGFTELQASSDQVMLTLTEYFATSKVFYNWPESQEEKVESLRKIVDTWIIRDPLAVLWTILHDSTDPLPKPPLSVPHTLFRRNPLVAGLFQFQFYLLMQECGIGVSNGWGSIISVAHLYEACRQGGYLDKTWPDMELIMDIHTREKLFAGRVPTSPQEAFKTTSLMFGMSAVNFAKNRRPGRHVKYAKDGPKLLTAQSPVASLLREQFNASGDFPDTYLTLAKVGGLLEDRAVASKSRTTGCADERGFLRQQWTTSHKLTVLQLLEVMRDANAAEQHMLRFDYISLHQRCLAILRKLRIVFDEDFREYWGPNWMEDEYQLLLIVRRIFTVASEASKVVEESKLKDHPVLRQTLEKANAVIEEFVGREGNVECEKLAKMHVLPHGPWDQQNNLE